MKVEAVALGAVGGGNDARARYSSVAVTLHWLIAALILLNFALAWRFVGHHTPGMSELVQLHKSVGICVLLLSLVRLGWRLAHRPPPLAGPASPLLKGAAHIVHWCLYGYMILAPLSGWLMVSVGVKSRPVRLFNLFPWPNVFGLHELPLPVRKQLEGAFLLTHIDLAYIAYGLLFLHLGGVLKHQFLDRDQTLWRMAPFLRHPIRPYSQLGVVKPGE